jgi:hypothetical protein
MEEENKEAILAIRARMASLFSKELLIFIVIA